ncbi:hypothetical protein [Taibaiella chishuiensis]|uniref:Uncharacterized protein n=1 Tax=Taibaiella chishuiensis TaxID=1434707 RepID=A0A2P8D354_9BACT|nr:hypothetical protein [Taibaiella chishuiensis]PSK91635.1 hypothetical protein B0I18_105220 [Taibaiella chishuiensis]
MKDKQQPSGHSQRLGSKIFPGTDQTSGYDQLASYHEHEHLVVNSGTLYGIMLNCYEGLAMMSAAQDHFGKIHSFLLSQSQLAHECYATWVSIERSLNNNEQLTLPQIIAEYPEYEKYYRIAEQLVSGLTGSFFRRAVMASAMYVSFHACKPCDLVMENFSNPDFEFGDNLEFPNDRFLHIASVFSPDTIRESVATFITSKTGDPCYQFLCDEANGLPAEADSAMVMKTQEALMYFMFDLFARHFEQRRSRSYALDYGPTFQKAISQQLIGYVALTENISTDDIGQFNEMSSYLSDPLKVHRSIGHTYESESIQLSPEPHFCTIIQPSELGVLASQIYEGDDFKRLNIMFRSADSMKRQYHFLEARHREWFEEANQQRIFIRKLYTYQDSTVIILVPFEDPNDLTSFLKEVPDDIQTLACVSHSIVPMLDDQWRAFLSTGIDYVYYLNDRSLVEVLDSDALKEGETAMFTDVLIEYNDVKAVALVFCYDNKATGVKEIHVVPCSPGYADFILGYIPLYYPGYAYDSVFFDLDIYISVQSVMRSIYMEEKSWYFRSFYISDIFK